MTEIAPDDPEAYIDYEILDITRNQLMLVMAEYRDTDCDLDDIDNRLHDVAGEYVLSALIDMGHQDKDDWLVSEALARRQSYKLLGFNIDFDLSDEAYANKYRAYIAGKMKNATAMTVADMLFTDIFGESEMFYWQTQKPNLSAA